MVRILILLFFLAFNANAFDLNEFIETTTFLSSDELQGRMAGSVYSHRTADFIASKFKDAGLKPLDNGTYLQRFTLNNQMGTDANVVGYVAAATKTDHSILILAHYDALGLDLSKSSEDRVRNGARDNAIGVAALIALARYFVQIPSLPVNLVFVATAAEETDKQGAHFYISQPLFDVSAILACLNIDGFNMTGPRRDFFVMPRQHNSLFNRIRSLATQAGWEYVSPGWEDFMDEKFDTAPFISLGIASATIWTGNKQLDGRPAPPVEYGEIHSVDDEINENWNWQGVEDHLNLYILVIEDLINSQRDFGFHRP